MENQFAKMDYQKKDFEGAISHYNTIAELNPENMSPMYKIANIRYEQENYAECVKVLTIAIKVGKNNKANVKMVAKAMVMRGRSYKQLGDNLKFEEDLKKAINFLSRISEVKFHKEKWLECIDFSERVIMLSEDNSFIISSDILEHRSISFIKIAIEAMNNGDTCLTIQCHKYAWKYAECKKKLALMLKCAEMLFNNGEYEKCATYLSWFYYNEQNLPKGYDQNDLKKVYELLVKSLRRVKLKKIAERLNLLDVSNVTLS